MPEEAAASRPVDMATYTFLSFGEPNADAAAEKPPRWLPLHTANDASALNKDLTLDGAPVCTQFRLRVLKAVGSSSSQAEVQATLSLKVRDHLPVYAVRAYMHALVMDVPPALSSPQCPHAMLGCTSYAQHTQPCWALKSWANCT